MLRPYASTVRGGPGGAGQRLAHALRLGHGGGERDDLILVGVVQRGQVLGIVQRGDDRGGIGRGAWADFGF